MATGPTQPDNAGDGETRREILLAEYERGHEIAHHADIVFYEVASIVWSANTLLLGFILEVNCDSENQRLVIAAALIGVLMTLFVPFIMSKLALRQEIAFEICREIESEMSLPHRFNKRIHDKYREGIRAKTAIRMITVGFILVWIGVGINSGRCLWKRAHVRSTMPLKVTKPASPQLG